MLIWLIGGKNSYSGSISLKELFRKGIYYYLNNMVFQHFKGFTVR